MLTPSSAADPAPGHGADVTPPAVGSTAVTYRVVSGLEAWVGKSLGHGTVPRPEEEDQSSACPTKWTLWSLERDRTGSRPRTI